MGPNLIITLCHLSETARHRGGVQITFPGDQTRKNTTGVPFETFGKDKYGRTIADVLLPDGTNVNHALVKDGWCWWYRKYAPGDVILEEFETRARAAEIGLWTDPHPVPPWEWRRANT